MMGFPSVWTENSADTLLDISVKYCIQHPYTFCTLNDTCSQYRLRDGLSLPEEICERMINVCKTELDKESCNKLLHIFQDPTTTRLRQVNLSNSFINDNVLEILTQHNIIELDISSCEILTGRSISLINKLRNYLQSLVVGNSVQIFSHNCSDHVNREDQPLDHPMGQICQTIEEHFKLLKNAVVDAPKLRKLVIDGLKKPTDVDYLKSFLQNTQFLSHLDLSRCNLGDLNCISSQKQLISLVLYNVSNLQIQQCLPAICQVKSLRHLDISTSMELNGSYRHPNKTLKTIVESLPNLTSLDISGTNLAGSRTQEREESPPDEKSSESKEETVLTDIPGLKCRVNRPLEFLGLLQTAHEACYRHHIPSKKITGDANEEQILVSAQVYCARKEMIQKVLNDLFHIFRFSTCSNIRLALDVVMEAMRLHVEDKSIQISGSASLFYIVKGEEKENFNIKIKRKIIKALLDAMFAHSTDVTMVRNGCLTLIHFKIPEDVFFEYERLVNLLLDIIDQEEQDEFVQRIGVYLLNSLACQVDGFQKQLVGDRGAISIMLQIVEDRVNRHLCDEVMETAWSTMWNVTDETPVNCARFLEGNGMDLFLKCLQVFPHKPELLRNMMGLLGNVAEVKELRHNLMRDEYLSVFSELLDSKSDGIEVSYNAAGIISHIASDGPELWAEHNISSVTRKMVLQRMVDAIETWQLETKRNINYRSFEPILRLLMVEHSPEAKHWAVWALANLTRVYPDKYCSLLKEEGGIDMLKQVIVNPGYARIYELANTIIVQCERYNGSEVPQELTIKEDEGDFI